MWYIKKAASKVIKISQDVLKQDSETVKLIKDIVSNKHEVMPIKKMNQLAGKTFQIQHFEETLTFICDKLKDFQLEYKSLKKRLNVLVLVAYLIKYGASGFIDEFRNIINTIKMYEELKAEEEQRKIQFILNQINQRAKYIHKLLYDKATLLREKEVARLIREKLIIMGGTNSLSAQTSNNPIAKKKLGDKVDDFLEHYVWKYTQKLDAKLDQITDALIQKIDQYIDGEIPDNFEIEQVQLIDKPSATKSQWDLSANTVKKQQEYIQQRLPTAKQEKEEIDILSLVDSNLQTKIKQAEKKKDLIKFQQIQEQTQVVGVVVAVSKQQDGKVLDDEQIQTFRKQLNDKAKDDQIKL